MLVSIGPYHRGQPKLLAMEKHKECYLKLVLQLTNRTQEYYLDSMKKLEERARKYYADPIDGDLKKSDNLIVKVNKDNNHKMWVMITTPLSTHHGWEHIFAVT
ncbi:hypothetical protein ACSBR1_034996 [Camellia fascicularis]